MKRNILYLVYVVVVSMAFIACKKDNGEDNGKDNNEIKRRMTIKGSVYHQYGDGIMLYMAGTDTMTIDWGDGTIIEIHTLNPDSLLQYHHHYNSSFAFNITIIGNVTALECWAMEPCFITDIDVSKNNKLTMLQCSWNWYLESLDLSKNTALTHLICYETRIADLDLSKNTALTYLVWGSLLCEDENNPLLASLNISNCKALTYLYCTDNGLTSLDVSNNVALTYLECRGNELTKLDVSKNTALTYLGCSWNNLTSLDVSKNIALTGLDCGGISDGMEYEYTYKDNNKLTSLDVSNNTSLTFLCCKDNKLTSTALNDLFETLHSNTFSEEKKIYVYKNPGSNDCKKNIAEKKGWKVY